VRQPACLQIPDFTCTYIDTNDIVTVFQCDAYSLGVGKKIIFITLTQDLAEH